MTTQTGASSKRPAPARRADFLFFREMTTRWMDNDPYGHINNVVYYSFFDTVVNRLLIDRGVLNITASPVIGLVAETQCRYFSSMAYPDTVHAGLRVSHIGNSSVRYEIGLFRNDDDVASAQGHFVHVYVDRESNKPVALPDALRTTLMSLTR